ncbi:hypothetical protein [Actinocatenispora comari]|uniref:Uncharacterized protein n=1 Tax=Actinocatenispora comari TaxID=2807577 RepID=A0A8J4AFP7_9ACTN|nr:hypothetical protein [Actinocatenispora comari]GIL30449.1 hypothetical protein NUM_57030 [Actinocatenispora comari]
MFSEQHISLMRSRWEELEAESTRLFDAMERVWNDPAFVVARDAYQKALDAYKPHADVWDEAYRQFKAAQTAAKRAGDAYRAALATYQLAG